MRATRDTRPVQLLDVRQVAALLSVPVRTVYVLAERRELAHYKLGRRLRFSADEVATYLESRYVDAEAQP